MANRRQTRFIKQVLYQLKKEFGFEITIHRVVSETKDLENGTIEPVIITQRVRRAIMLPDDSQRKFEYDLAFIAAAKNFTYGGFYDTSIRRVIIDVADLRGFEVAIDDYFIWNEKRWNISRIDWFELQTGIVLYAKMVEGTVRYQVSTLSLESTVTFSDEVI